MHSARSPKSPIVEFSLHVFLFMISELSFASSAFLHRLPLNKTEDASFDDLFTTASYTSLAVGLMTGVFGVGALAKSAVSTYQRLPSLSTCCSSIWNRIKSPNRAEVIAQENLDSSHYSAKAFFSYGSGVSFLIVSSLNQALAAMLDRIPASKAPKDFDSLYTAASYIALALGIETGAVAILKIAEGLSDNYQSVTSSLWRRPAAPAQPPIVPSQTEEEIVVNYRRF